MCHGHNLMQLNWTEANNHAEAYYCPNNSGCMAYIHIMLTTIDWGLQKIISQLVHADSRWSDFYSVQRKEWVEPDQQWQKGHFQFPVPRRNQDQREGNLPIEWHRFVGLVHIPAAAIVPQMVSGEFLLSWKISSSSECALSPCFQLSVRTFVASSSW